MTTKLKGQMADLDALVDQLGKLTVLETADLVKKLESAWGVSAAAPLFAFWFLVMCAIWLFLLGVARIFTGTFTVAEITLTVVIGVACLFGLGTASRRGPTIPFGARLGTIAAFAVLQFAEMWLSVQPFITRR